MNKIKKASTIVLACTAGCFLSSTNADILFFLLDEGGQEAWDTALNAERQEVYEQFNLTTVFGDPGIAGLDGPVFIGDIGIDSNLNPFGEGGRAGRGPGGTGLTLVGASAGFGNEDTTLVAGYFVDCLDVFSVGEMPTAMELNVTSLLGSNTAAITVYDPNENEVARIPTFPAPASGTRLGILATDGDVIGRVNIYDTAGGADGITGDLIAYVQGPLPAALTDLEIITGTLLNGGLENLLESDDSYVTIRSGLGHRISEVHLMEAVVRARTEVTEPSFISITLETQSTEPDTVGSIRLRNWRTGDFELVGQYRVGFSEDTFIFELADALDFIRSSGEMELSIKHVVFVPYLAFRFNSLFDVVEIAIL